MPYDTSRDTFGNNVFAGPLARTITDAAVMHRVLGGPSDKDPWSLGHAPQPMSPKLAGESLSGVRIGYIELMANPRLAADVRANTLQALDAWRDLGAEVEPVTDKIDWIEYEGRVLYQAGFHVTCAQYLPKWQNQMDPVTLAFMERGSKFTLADFRNAQFARTILFRKIQTLFERYDFLVSPTNSRTALDATHDAANDEVIVDGDHRVEPRPRLGLGEEGHLRLVSARTDCETLECLAHRYSFQPIVTGTHRTIRRKLRTRYSGSPTRWLGNVFGECCGSPSPAPTPVRTTPGAGTQTVAHGSTAPNLD